ncbi:hypothetical protein HNO88_002552 [Novosphingobium chloroacetimidivorans]|uniref:DUF1552 domain-containing protein n=1 Tax=Novosphingobium chloroacetimidivorans TaxID=1428314 RepID=A0A7W7NW63_9SPHN|nr:DUF1552 domain-containing protein [Novosphingobium chloroacetimidivorans]MBB4859223.1 hypothetical protein [Novosphingobium chloroacetimidivorans]
MTSLSRRTMLRGAIGSAAVGVALPLLDCFLDTNGVALAATGQRIPVRFGTWVWGCGFIPEKWIPTTVGHGYALPADLAPLEPYRDKLALFSGFDVKLDGVANKPHITGCLGLRTGIPVPNEDVKAPTLDVLIAQKIGGETRFRSLDVSTCGLKKSYSYHAAGSPNPSETSPSALYRRIFGAGFQDPSALAFEPDTRIMARRSVLSAVTDDRQRLMRTVSASDRARLDEYFTSIRQIEQQLDLQLQPPAPVKDFTRPAAPDEEGQGSEMGQVMETHRIMADLLAKALQVNQTRVFNVLFSDTASNLRREGETTTHHTLTHEEPADAVLGYQKEHSYFATQSMVAWKEFLDSLASIPEGDGTLLDNCLVMAHSDCSIAKAHAVEGIPTMIAGNSGGGVRTGYHLDGKGDSIARLGLTVQQAMGVQVEKWGQLSMETNRTITELIA